MMGAYWEGAKQKIGYDVSGTDAFCRPMTERIYVVPPPPRWRRLLLRTYRLGLTKWRRIVRVRANG